MNRDWLTWTARACRPIRFKHDRRAAERELLAHLEDEALALMESGLTREQAQKKALAAMGDAEEVGRQLAAVHRPWLGYLWIWSRRVLILCMVVAIFLAFGFRDRVSIYFGGYYPRWWQDSPTYNSIGGDYEEYYTYTDLTPDCRDESDGYTFTVPAAMIAYNEPYVMSNDRGGYQMEENTTLYLTVRASTWLLTMTGCTAFPDFYAVDDRGNHYGSCADLSDVIYAWQYDRWLLGNDFATGLRTSVYEAWVENLDPEADWIELRYDRDGRDVRLRIDLTGGVEQ